MGQSLKTRRDVIVGNPQRIIKIRQEKIKNAGQRVRS